MKTGKAKLRTYTVVEVWRGIAVGAKNFKRLSAAQKYMGKRLLHRNSREDDVQIFETSIPLSKGQKLILE